MEILDLVVQDVANDSSDSPVGDGDGAGLYTFWKLFVDSGLQEEKRKLVETRWRMRDKEAER